MEITVGEAINIVSSYLDLDSDVHTEYLDSIKVLCETSKKYLLWQEQYKKRLVNDTIAILTEIQLEMEEYEPKWVENDEQAAVSCRTWEDLDGIIQQKIDRLNTRNEDT